MKLSNEIALKQEAWRIFGIPDLYVFVKSLDMLFPEDSVLYLEDCISKDIQDFMRSRHMKEEHKGKAFLFNPILPFIIDRPENMDFWMPIVHENLVGLWELMEHHAESEICSSLYVLKDDEVLMEGHDWFDGVFYVTSEIPEEKIKAFCETLGLMYEPVDFGP